jgi:hypothetical protein
MHERSKVRLRVGDVLGNTGAALEILFGLGNFFLFSCLRTKRH